MYGTHDNIEDLNQFRANGPLSLQDVFRRCNFSDGDKEKVLNFINEIPFFSELYKQERLFIGARYYNYKSIENYV